MAHEIHKDQNGKSSFAYVGEKPWHGLGQELTQGAPLTTWEQEAGFNWQIKEGPVQSQIMLPDPANPELTTTQTLVLADRKMLYRSDTLNPLAVVSNRYNVVQPKEILYFYEDLVESAGFQLETAGILFGGRRFFALAKTNYGDDIIAGDHVDQYLLLTTACDGSLATNALFTSVRVVCNNTLQMSLHQGSHKQRVRVPHSRQFDPKAVKEELGIAGETWNQFLVDTRKLASKEMSKSQAIYFLRDLVGDPKEAVEDQKPGAANLMTTLFNLWNSESMGNELAGHTAWGMLNAVTQYVDHGTGHKTRDAAINSAWLGDGAKLKEQAFDLLLATA